MSVSIKKLPGVESVNVSLNKGLVAIKLAPGNKVTIAEIRKAILNDGFAPKDAQVAAVGELVSQGGRPAFKVAGTNEVFPVQSKSQESWQSKEGKRVTVKGVISAPAGQGQPGTLDITSTS